MEDFHIVAKDQAQGSKKRSKPNSKDAPRTGKAKSEKTENNTKLSGETPPKETKTQPSPWVKIIKFVAKIGGSVISFFQTKIGLLVARYMFSSIENSFNEKRKQILRDAKTPESEAIAKEADLLHQYHKLAYVQARKSFLYAVTAAFAGLIVLITAAIMLLIGKSSDTTIMTTLSGAFVELISGLFFYLYAKSLKQLNHFEQKIQDNLWASQRSNQLPLEERKSTTIDIIRSFVSAEGRQKSENVYEPQEEFVKETSRGRYRMRLSPLRKDTVPFNMSKKTYKRVYPPDEERERKRRFGPIFIAMQITLLTVIWVMLANRLKIYIERPSTSEREMVILFFAGILWFIISGRILIVRRFYVSFYLIPISISLIKVFEILLTTIKYFTIHRGYQVLRDFEFIPNSTIAFFTNYFDGFTLLYGIVIAFIITRSWEQFDNINRAFDREADAVKTLYDEVFYLRGSRDKYVVKEITMSLRYYVHHVIAHYPDEVKMPEVVQRVTQTVTEGDIILEETRGKIKTLIHSGGIRTKEEEIIIPKLIYGLNDLINVRGDRITFASQRAFASLRLVTLITSIIFLLPFYFMGFTAQSGFLENFIIVCVTMLAFLIILIVEDLDEPFGGIWKISVDSWQRILQDMDSEKRRFELENLDKPQRTMTDSRRSRRADEAKRDGRKKTSK